MKTWYRFHFIKQYIKLHIFYCLIHIDYALNCFKVLICKVNSRVTNGKMAAANDIQWSIFCDICDRFRYEFQIKYTKRCEIIEIENRQKLTSSKYKFREWSASVFLYGMFAFRYFFRFFRWCIPDVQYYLSRHFAFVPFWYSVFVGCSFFFEHFPLFEMHCGSSRS